MTMKALSIRQPWAWLILHAGKDIENRTWRTAYRGPVLIHAAQTMTRADYMLCRAFLLEIDRQGPIDLPTPEDLPRGGIVGQAEVVACLQRSPSPWFTGPYGFQLANARPLPFEPCSGALGFFNP